MIIDLILDRKEAEIYEDYEYSPYLFALFVRDYESENDRTPISNAFASRDEDRVRDELCAYVVNNQYNPKICNYIKNRIWTQRCGDTEVGTFYFVPYDSMGQHGTDIWEIALTATEIEYFRRRHEWIINHVGGAWFNRYIEALYYTQD